MRWTIPGIKKLVREALARAGLKAEVISVEWLGIWCAPRSGIGSEFRCARATLRAPDGRTLVKAVTVERNGGYSIR